MSRNKKNTDEHHYETLILKSNDRQILTLKPISPLSLGFAPVYDKFTIKVDYLKNINKLILDFSELKFYDSYFVVFKQSLEKNCNNMEIEFEIINLPDEAKHFLDVLSPKGNIENEIKEGPIWYLYIADIGDKSKTFLKDSYLFVEFLGNIVIKMLSLLIKPRNIRWKDFPHHFTQAGVNSVPIALLIVFLIGLISGYQGALQLEQVGADIFIADLIGISITRELAPLMVSILVAGRSGSAFAAEIGTMKVSEEIDALQSMGFDYVRFLVLPRVLSVMLAMPILILLADLAGIFGGLVAALTTLDVTVIGYINQLHRALDYSDIFTGVGKSIVFGFLISTVGCFRGLQVRGGAESVGKFTTASVVSGIFLIILFDALFSYIFSVLGI